MPNQLKRDPTRTTMLRKRFMADMTRRFKELSRAIQILVVEDDVFGLEGPTILQVRQAWRFRTDANKVKAYRAWLQQQVDAGILTPVGGVSGKPWTAPYIESAYKKGGLRAYTDLRAEELANHPSLFKGGQAEFIRTAFSQPEALHKIELLYERAFDELKGVTAAMGQQMSRTLAEGLAQGYGPRKIASALRKNVSNITKTRANVIARTEIIRAHAEGQLDAFERLGVDEVGVMAEWSTAGDDRVCIECGELEGVVMTVKEARGLLPRHPNCRCCWIPAQKARKEKGQKWGKEKDIAIEKSIQAEAPKTIKRTAVEVKRRSSWSGKEFFRKPLKGGDVVGVVKTKGDLPPIKASKSLIGAKNNLKSKYSKAFNGKRRVSIDHTIGEIDSDLAKESLDELARLVDNYPVVINKIRVFDSKTDAFFAAFDNVKGELVLNKAVYKNKEIFRKVMEKRRLEGIMPRNLREIMTHEYGHAIEANLDFNTRMEIGAKYFNVGASYIKKEISIYGASNEAEMFAEAFVQWERGVPSKFTKELMRMAKIKRSLCSYQKIGGNSFYFLFQIITERDDNIVYGMEYK